MSLRKINELDLVKSGNCTINLSHVRQPARSQSLSAEAIAWDSIKKALKGTYDDEVWEHLAGTTSAPFEAGEHKEIAVKVIDDRGNELLVTKSL